MQSLSCRAATKPKIARCEDFIEVEPGDELALMKAVAAVGPISVVIYTKLPTFVSYNSGIYNDPRCINAGVPDHAVLVVGYGSKLVRSRKYDYWIVKNSWSTNWGEEGHILIGRNNGNMCGIASGATYPVGVTAV